MRMSVRKNDPGYNQDAHLYQPYLNGEKLDDCFTADEKAGVAWVMVRGEDGKIVVENGKVKEKAVFGKIELRRVRK